MGARAKKWYITGCSTSTTHVYHPFVYYVLLSVLVVLWGIGNTARAEPSPYCATGMLPSGGIYLISAPPAWEPDTGDLVVYAPGYSSPSDAVTIPDISEEAVTMLGSMGLAVATLNYRKSGLAVKQGVADVTELLDYFYADPLGCGYGRPAHTYLVGGSEGALIATLKLEQEVQSLSPQVDGGLALCGPIGDFARQLNYFLDFRVIFDYFFPGIIPGSPVNIPQAVIDNWLTVYEPQVVAAILSSPANTKKLLRITGAAVDAFDNSSMLTTVLGILRYNIVATNDAIATLGGQAFDNSRRIYFGSGSIFLDWRINRSVPRFRADGNAMLELRTYYQTAGILQDAGGQGTRLPLVSAHTVADPIVPYWHEPIYRLKTLLAGSALLHVNFPVFRYGHCNFTADELVALLTILANRVAGPLP